MTVQTNAYATSGASRKAKLLLLEEEDERSTVDVAHEIPESNVKVNIMVALLHPSE